MFNNGITIFCTVALIFGIGVKMLYLLFPPDISVKKARFKIFLFNLKKFDLDFSSPSKKKIKKKIDFKILKGFKKPYKPDPEPAAYTL